jgi:nucleotide-binding universal stress UspA family protein
VSRCAASGITVRAHQSRDDPAVAIVSVAAEVGADLVVVGNKGLKGLKRLVVGSVPSKVVHDAPCSTLVVHTS